MNLRKNTQMTFADYVAAQRFTDTPRGHFIEDTQAHIRDNSFPPVATLDELKAFLATQAACEEAYRQAESVWRQFGRATKRPKR
jgi:hypothetical protein